jgi:hypothetical protein
MSPRSNPAAAIADNSVDPPRANPFQPYLHGGHEATAWNHAGPFAPFDHYLPKSFRIDEKLYSYVISSN